jgi:hypothetical protein
MAGPNAVGPWVPLGGRSRRYFNPTTGQTISRRAYDRLYGRFSGATLIATPEVLAASRRQPRESTREKFFRVVRRVSGRGESPSRAARAEHMSPETLKRYDRDRGALRYNRRQRRGEVWRAGVVTFADAFGQVHHNVPFDHREIKTMSAYAGALKMAQHPNPGVRARGALALSTFAGTTVYDVAGNAYTLLTDTDAYLALKERLGDDPMDYFVSGEERIAA